MPEPHKERDEMITDKRPPIEADSTDPAAQSLSDALRVSFKLLTLIMLGLVIAFLATGLKSVKPNEKGIVKVFGTVQRTVGPGFTYNWPFPIGEIEIIATDKQKMTLDDFWMHETPDQKTKKLEERRVRYEGLRPGWDGAVLTGDRYLLHTRLVVYYRIEDPILYRQNVGPAEPTTYVEVSQSETKTKLELIRSAVCSAGIDAAGIRTADGMMRGQRDVFASLVHRRANDALDAMKTGLRITDVVIPKATWPLKALPAYLAAQRASKDAEQRKNEARSNAEETLRSVAGGYYVDFVGHPWGTREAERSADQAQTGRYNLIGQYAEVRKKLAMAKEEDQRKMLREQAGKLLAMIDDILANHAQGESRRIISEAQSYETDVKQRVLARVQEFEELLPEYRESPELFIQRHWAAAREQILDSRQNEKVYLAPGETVLRISSDPKIARRLQKQRIEADGENSE